MLVAIRNVAFLLAPALGAWAWQASSPSSQADWPMYNHDYAATGFSKLAEITPKNAANLKQVCSYALPETSTFERSVVAINGTLYFTTGQYTYALDASNCALRWRV